MKAHQEKNLLPDKSYCITSIFKGNKGWRNQSIRSNQLRMKGI